jgi:hypothetical protein
VVLFGCAAATPGMRHDPPARSAVRVDEGPRLPQVRDGRERLLASARMMLGHRHVSRRGFPDDCTGFVRAAYASIGFTLMSEGHLSDNGVTAIWRFARMHGRTFEGGHPMPGDLVFFRNTYDRNHDGAHDDGLTHVAIVEGEDPDGTVRILHRTAHGIVREHMNLLRPREHLGRDGQVINDYLRVDRSGFAATTGDLFVGYATLFREPLRVARASTKVHRRLRSP